MNIAARRALRQWCLQDVLILQGEEAQHRRGRFVPLGRRRGVRCRVKCSILQGGRRPFRRQKCDPAAPGRGPAHRASDALCWRECRAHWKYRSRDMQGEARHIHQRWTRPRLLGVRSRGHERRGCASCVRAGVGIFRPCVRPRAPGHQLRAGAVVRRLHAGRTGRARAGGTRVGASLQGVGFRWWRAGPARRARQGATFGLFSHGARVRTCKVRATHEQGEAKRRRRRATRREKRREPTGVPPLGLRAGSEIMQDMYRSCRDDKQRADACKGPNMSGPSEALFAPAGMGPRGPGAPRRPKIGYLFGAPGHQW